VRIPSLLDVDSGLAPGLLPSLSGRGELARAAAADPLPLGPGGLARTGRTKSSLRDFIQHLSITAGRTCPDAPCVSNPLAPSV
jgi:hypothetical protein